MAQQSTDPADVIARLEAAAVRLRGGAEATTMLSAPAASLASTAPTLARELTDAQQRMRAACDRLAELEVELGWDVRVSRGT